MTRGKIYLIKEIHLKEGGMPICGRNGYIGDHFLILEPRANTQDDPDWIPISEVAFLKGVHDPKMDTDTKPEQIRFL